MATVTGASTRGGNRWITSGDAARRLAVTAETIRRWVDTGTLDGFREARKVRRRYFVSEQAVEELRRRRESGEHSPSEELHRLRERVAELEAARHGRELDQLSRERDQYRAENSALKEALLRLNAAMEHTEQAATAHAAALREQREALSVLLTPHSPGEDLRARPSDTMHK